MGGIAGVAQCPRCPHSRASTVVGVATGNSHLDGVAYGSSDLAGSGAPPQGRGVQMMVAEEEELEVVQVLSQEIPELLAT